VEIKRIKYQHPVLERYRRQGIPLAAVAREIGISYSYLYTIARGMRPSKRVDEAIREFEIKTKKND
jgi:hypothetical protein